MAAVTKEISVRAAAQLRRALEAYQIAQVHLQFVTETITDVYDLPGRIVAIDGTTVTCGAADGD